MLQVLSRSQSQATYQTHKPNKLHTFNYFGLAFLLFFFNLGALAETVDIPAGSLSKAINRFAQINNIDVVMDESKLTGKTTSGLEGEFSIEKGFSVLLQGSGYFAERTPSGYIIKPLQNNSQSGPEQLGPINVIGTAPERYQATSASSATGGADVDLIDTPRSVQVIPEQVFIDQGARDLRDVLRNVSGVQSRNVSGGSTDTFIVRGVETQNIFQDGFQLDAGSTRIQASNIERVEVVKGPTAILSGQSQAGGVINVITKRPQAKSRHIATTNFDEFGQRELLIDSTGKLNKDGSLLYRIVGSTENSDTFREAASDAEIDRNLLAPSLTWDIDDSNSLTASLEIISTELPIDNGTVVVQATDGSLDVADVDRSLRFGEDDDINDSTQRTLRLEYKHLFANDWQLDADFSFQSAETAFSQFSSAFGFAGTIIPGQPFFSSVAAGLLPPPFGLGGATISTSTIPEGGVIGRVANTLQTDRERLQFAFRFSGKTELGSTLHNLSLGADFNRRELDNNSFGDLISGADAGLGALGLGTALVSNFDGFDPFNPQFGATNGATTPVSTISATDTQIGISVSDNIEINEQWNALVGLRFDRFDRDGETLNIIDNIPVATLVGAGLPAATAALLAPALFVPSNQIADTSQDTQNEFSPNVGVVYQPTEQIALFASYSEAFIPQFTTNLLTGEVIDVEPIESDQIEIGIKGAFLNEKLIVNLAYYDLTRENVLGSLSQITGLAIASDEETTRGIEFDTSVQFANGLSLIFNFAHILDAEISGGGNTGNTPRNVSENSANLWATYEFTQGALRGFGFGGGANHIGSRFVDDANTFELDSYTTYDLTAFYHVPIGKSSQLRFQAGVKNLTDEEFFIPNTGPLVIGVGAPRTIFTSIGIEF